MCAVDKHNPCPQLCLSGRDAALLRPFFCPFIHLQHLCYIMLLKVMVKSEKRMFTQKSTLITATVLLLIISLSTPVYASFEKGREAFVKRDFSTAFKNWLPLAKKGDSDVAATIAVMFHTGTGVKQSYEQAFYWYKQAAEKGNVAAQANLGVMYAKGTGTKRNYVESYAWYSAAAESLPGTKIGSALWGIDYLATQMTPEEVKKAKALTDAYIKKYTKKKAK